MTRNYKQEYANYDGTEAVKKKRAQRNKARRMLEAKGVVHKGDGKDVDHKKPLSKGGQRSSTTYEQNRLLLIVRLNATQMAA